MSPSTEDQFVLNEEIWRGWNEKRKLRERQLARKVKIEAAVVFAFLAIGSIVYLVVR
jgi:hypothetical protein